jgi:hypothetical protein
MPKPNGFVLATLVAVVVVFAVHFLDFPGSVPRFEKLSHGGVLFDVAPAGTVNATYERLSGFGEAGRSSYMLRNATVDVLLPLSLLPFLVLLMLRALRRRGWSRFVKGSLLAIPFVYVGFDLLENAVVLNLLANYPARAPFLAMLLPYVTVVKRAASLLAIFLPIGLLGVGFVIGRRNRSTARMGISTG